MRKRLAWAAEVVGVALVAAGLAQVSPSAALVAAGAYVLAASNLRGER